MQSYRQSVAILGASPKPGRYSFKAQEMLMANGYAVFPIAPSAPEVLGVKCWKTLLDFPDPVDTVTLYVGPQRLDGLLPGILEKKPRRVIFNPGTESSLHEDALVKEGIGVLRACTLVLLQTRQF